MCEGCGGQSHTEGRRGIGSHRSCDLRTGCGRRGRGYDRGCCGSLGRGRTHTEHPGIEVLLGQEMHLNRPAWLVPLGLRMLLRGGHELIGQHVREAGESFEVAGRQLDGKQVGDEGAPMADGRGPVIHRAAHGGGDLHRLDLGLEGLGEDTMNRSFEPSLDTIEHSHSLLLTSVGLLIVTGHGRSARMSLDLEPDFPDWTAGPVWISGWSSPTLCERARVAEWQTRWLQVPVSERAWGFKSPLAHPWRPRFVQVTGLGRFVIPPEKRLLIPP